MKATKITKEIASVAVRAYPSTRKKLKLRSVKEGRPIPAILRDLVEGNAKQAA